MGEHTNTIIAIIIATIFSRMFLKKLKRDGTRTERLIRKAQQNNCVTNGRYVDSTTIFEDPDSSSYNRRRRREHVRYGYSVNGITYYKYLWFSGNGVTVDYPDTVTVCYDPRKPSKAVCMEENSLAARRQTGCLGSVVIWVIVAAIVLNTFNFLLG